MSNTLMDIIAEKFEKQKDSLVEELDEHLTCFDLNEEYKNEIEKSFNSNTKLIFDMDKDGKTFLDFVIKVYGKTNIASFHYIEFEKDENLGEEFSKQLIYLKGKLDLVNKIFDFKKNDLFTYGNYQNMRDAQYNFTSFRAQNSDILIKVEEDYAYGIFCSHGDHKLIIKIKKDFFENPVLEMYVTEDSEEIENLNEENVGKILNILKTRKGYLKEFKIFQIEN